MRGHRSAGYGFVALSNAEAAQKAVDQLNKTELDGRQVIVEIAKPSDQKNKEKKERKAKRRPGRRGSKAVPGEVTEAEANGDAPKPDDAIEPAATGPRKIKRRKKKVSVCPSPSTAAYSHSYMRSASLRLRLKVRPRSLPTPPRPKGRPKLLSPTSVGPGFNVLLAPRGRIPLESLLRPYSL